ncbi:MAG: hypothetical protein R3247_16585 [Rhodothermales bacterium]|nr:hypothetical protein [Rhodothermales bacterium]
MSMYELQDVTLGDIEGQGYAFKRSTAFGKARRGVFFPRDEEDLEKLENAETLTFTGPCYYRTRGPRDREFEVAIVEVVPTRFGPRADFEAIENPDPVRETEVEAEA